MNANIIKKLLDKYFDGETTLEEEQLLRDYFRDKPESDFDAYRDYFTFIDANQRSKVLINNKPKKQRFRYAGTVAAALMIITITAAMVISSNISRQNDAKITKEALMTVMYHINTSTQNLTALSKIEENFAQLEVLNELKKLNSTNIPKETK